MRSLAVADDGSQLTAGAGRDVDEWPERAGGEQLLAPAGPNAQLAGLETDSLGDRALPDTGLATQQHDPPRPGGHVDDHGTKVVEHVVALQELAHEQARGTAQKAHHASPYRRNRGTAAAFAVLEARGSASRSR